MNIEAQRPKLVVPTALLAGHPATLAFQLDMRRPGSRLIDFEVAFARIHTLDLGLAALGFTKTRTFQSDFEGHTVLAELHYDGGLNVFLFPICIWVDPECPFEQRRRWCWVRPATTASGVGGHD